MIALHNQDEGVGRELPKRVHIHPTQKRKCNYKSNGPAQHFNSLTYSAAASGRTR